MTLILSGTNGLSDVDGSAATPAIRGTDTNTGIFFPAADTIAFAEGGAEVARFDSAGNLGLGTTSPTERLTVAGNIKLGTSGTTYIYGPSTTGRSFLSNSDSTAYIGIYGSSYGSGSNSILSFVTGTSNVMTMDASGNLGLGVTPSAWLSDYKVQQLGSTSSVYGRVATNETGVNQNWYRDASAVFRYIGNGYAAAYTQLSGGGHAWSNGANNTSGAGAALTLTTAMTLDASGRLGIGTTSPANLLHVKGSGNYDGVISVDNGSTTGGGVLAIRQNGVVCGYYTTNGVAQGNTGSDIAVYAETGRVITFFTGGSATERMRLDTSGNLGVGTTNPAGRKARIAGEFSVTNDSSNAYEIYFQSTSSYARIGPTYNAGGAFVPLTFWTSDTERARIDTSGNFFVNVTTLTNLENGTTNSGCIRSNGTVEVAKNSTSTLNVVEFYNPNGNIGKIQIAGSATTYATSSDYRLKKDVQPMTGALARVAALKPVTYKWKADGSDGEGFIAHELQTVVPDAVTGQKDETKIQEYEISPAVPATFDEEGNELTPAVEAVMGEREVPVYQGIDTSFLVATLTAAIQELKAEFDAYKLTHP